MIQISKQDLIKLRTETKAGVMDVRKALEEANGDVTKAKEILESMGIAKAESKSERATGSGIVETYTHGEGKIGVMVEVACETDFVAKTDEFKSLVHDITLQIAAMDPTSVDELMAQPFIKDPGRTISDLIKANISKTGENIKVKRFQRFVLGA